MTELDCRAMTRRLIVAGYRAEAAAWAAWNQHMQTRAQAAKSYDDSHAPHP